MRPTEEETPPNVLASKYVVLKREWFKAALDAIDRALAQPNFGNITRELTTARAALVAEGVEVECQHE